MDLQALKTELDTDPLVLGYSDGLPWNDQAKAEADLALLQTVRAVDVETLSGSQLFESIDDTEWQARTAEQKADIQFVVSLGDNIQISSGTKARTMMTRALSGATNSLAALGVLGSKNVTRAEELGFAGVNVGNIQNARDLP